MVPINDWISLGCRDTNYSYCDCCIDGWIYSIDRPAFLLVEAHSKRERGAETLISVSSTMVCAACRHWLSCWRLRLCRCFGVRRRGWMPRWVGGVAVLRGVPCALRKCAVSGLATERRIHAAVVAQWVAVGVADEGAMRRGPQVHTVIAYYINGPAV